MAIFGSNSKEEVRQSTSNTNSTTIITDCIDINGNITGCGAIHIDGTVHGDINVEESIIIGTSGAVYGNIKSKSIIISGKLEGSISCASLEITQFGTVSEKIDADEIILDGTVNATLIAKNTIKITEHGNLTTKHLECKHLIVNGHVDGDVTTSELLEINKHGEVKGTMVVKKIKVTEGGLMLGTMLSYEAPESRSPVLEHKVEAEVADTDELL
jgi:cytoskeletal protein CcmA (bactofilin family)